MTSSALENRLPWTSLLALSMGAFITILTEALPAALLPQMAGDLGVSQAWIGQTVTAYAVGSLVAAIPLVTATRSMRRRPLLMAAVLGFAVANSVTALSGNFTLTMAARVVAGMAAGLLWALLAGYATRLVAPQLHGRAIAVAMVGTPLALSLGVPAGGWLGLALGWRWCFGLASVLALLLWVWMGLRLPDFPGQAQRQRMPMAAVLRTPGVRSVLMVVLFYVLAHNILYTYIAPFLAANGVHVRIDLALLVFGVAALPGIWLTGLFVDRHLYRMSMASILLFCGAVLMLGASWGGPPPGPGGIGRLGICLRRLRHLVPDSAGAGGRGAGRHGPVPAGDDVEHRHRRWRPGGRAADRELGGLGSLRRCCWCCWAWRWSVSGSLRGQAAAALRYRSRMASAEVCSGPNCGCRSSARL